MSNHSGTEGSLQQAQQQTPHSQQQHHHHQQQQSQNQNVNLGAEIAVESDKAAMDITEDVPSSSYDRFPEIPEPAEPSDIFVQSMSNFIDQDHLKNIIETQRHMLTRFEKTNEMLLNFNVLSSSRFAASALELKKHTALLVDMKKDLDSVFRRIRNLKQTLGKLYPDAFSACSDVFNLLEVAEGVEEEDEVNKSSIASTSSEESIEPETPKIFIGDRTKPVFPPASDNDS